jgi:hypothetical protein
MTTTTTTTAETRCEHDLAAWECAYCAWPRLVVESETARTTRTAERLAASIRRAIRNHERERDMLRGYSLVTASMLAAIESSATAAARPFGGDSVGIYERTLDAFAIWIARQDRDGIDAVRGDSSHVRSLARRIATRLARGAGTGRGHMPRLAIGQHAPECDRGECVTYCGAVMLDDALRGLVVRAYRAGETPNDRPPTAGEREAIADTLDYERVAGSPDYPRWLDAFGESAPNVGSAHPFGHRAPGVPERDAPSVKRASMTAAARWLGLNAALVGAALDHVRKTRRGYAFDLRRIAAAVGDTRHLANVKREIVRTLETLAAVDIDSLAVYESRRTLSQSRPMTARHRCESVKCERSHAVPIIEGTYRGGIKTDVDSPRSAYPCTEHDAGECATECPSRVARSARIERVAAVTTRDEYQSAVSSL